ncbi:MAG: RibD family protein, partial [Steroidobacteraceae bacterium]
IRLKQAMSVDARTALADGASRWITGAAARADVQQWRARSSCIVTGIGTVLADDPTFTVRIGPQPRRQPLRIVLDSRLRMPSAAKLLREPGATLVLTTADAASSTLSSADVRVERLAGDERGVDLGAVVDRLAALDMNEVWIEAGPALAGAWLGSGLVDEWILYVAPVMLGVDARPLAHIAARASLEAAPRFVFHDVQQFEPDLRLILRPARH